MNNNKTQNIPSAWGEKKYNSVSALDATIIIGQARFSILYNDVIRLEYQKDCHFEDRPSIAVLQRAFNKPDFTYVISKSTLIITTPALELTYDFSKESNFTQENLRKL